MKSIKSILITVTCITMLFLSIDIIVIGYVNTRSLVLNNVEERLLASTQSGADSVDAWLNNHVAEIELIADNLALKGLDPDTVNPFLEQEFNLLSDYSSFWLSDLNGDWYSFNGNSGSIAERAYFPQVIESKKTVISDPLIGKADGALAVVLAVPVNVNGEMKAILGANLKVASILDVISAIKIGNTGHIAMYQSDGLVVADRNKPDGTLEYNPFMDSSSYLYPVRDEILKSTGSGLTSAVDGKEKLFVSYVRMEGTNWIFIGETKQSEYLPSLTNGVNEYTAPLADYLRLCIIGALICLIVADIVVFIFASFLTRPIKAFHYAADQISGGNLTVEIDTRPKNEFGTMARSLESIKTKISKIVLDIKDSAGLVREHSKRLRDIATSLTEDAKKTTEGSKDIMTSCNTNAETSRTISSEVNDIADSLSVINDNIHNIRENAETSSKTALEGDKSVNRVVAQMERINEVVGEASGVISQVSESSENISGFVSVISSISGQTNLLALNASIEAARAGESGRGFAVVAEEIGKLASESSDAAKRISEMVSEMQANTEKAISSITRGTQEVEEGRQVVIGAGNSFKTIHEQIDGLLSQIQSVTEDIEVIKSKNSSLVDAAAEVEASSQETAAQAEISSEYMNEQLTAIDEIEKEITALAKMAKNLNNNMAIFKVPEQMENAENKESIGNTDNTEKAAVQ